jgi:4-hydroxy-tetrahydrodipicolinate synthase
MLKRLGVLKANEHRLPLIPASPDLEKQLDIILDDLGMV